MISEKERSSYLYLATHQGIHGPNNGGLPRSPVERPLSLELANAKLHSLLHAAAKTVRYMAVQPRGEGSKSPGRYIHGDVGANAVTLSLAICTTRGSVLLAYVRKPLYAARRV